MKGNKMIAVDPGANGGIAYDTENGVQCVKMPGTIRDLLIAIEELREAHSVAVVERVGQHRAGNSASASVTFARHCGHLDMAFEAAGFDVVTVTPQQWQKVFHPLSKDKRTRKNQIKEKVASLFPHIKVTLWNADALALWHYADKHLDL